MIDFELEIKALQKHKLILNSNLKLSLQILSYGNKQLSNFIEKYKNPFIKKVEPQFYELSLENIYKEENFYDFLINQLNELFLDKKLYKTVYYLIENLGSNGYLIENENYNIPQKEFEKALDILQNLSPDGVGARSLEECLILQLKKQNKIDRYIEKIIKYHLKDIASNDHMYISKCLNISVEKVNKKIEAIKKLNPIPSRGFNVNYEKNYITPDFLIEKINNSIEVKINYLAFPKFQLNEEVDCIKNKDLQKLKSDAVYLIESIEKRKITLEKIVYKVVEYQEDYFKNSYLKPLSLNDISKSLSLSQSTISRAIKEKYICFNKKTIPLKFFFERKINGKSNQKIGVSEIKKIIEMIIKNEKRSLTDIEIVKVLETKNIKISRRTISKYRNEMNIPASIFRT